MTIYVESANKIQIIHKVRSLLFICISSTLLYLALYFTQRAIYLNGLSINVADIVLKGTDPNHTHLLYSSVIYYAGIVALFLLYLWLMLLCYRGQLADKRSIILALFFPVLFNIGFLYGRPYLSIDIFSYLAHGYLGTIPGSNPYIDAASEVAKTSFGRELVPWGWLPVHGISPYGPLWTQIEIGVLHLTREVSSAILLIKTLIVISSLLCGVVIWRILGHVHPKYQLFGTLCYLWNPMIIIEFASEGHNDALMFFFTLLSLLLALESRPTQSLVMLLLGVLTKYIPLIFLPAQIIYFWRQYSAEPKRSKLLMQIFLGLAFGTLVAVILYSPLWAGLKTFKGISESSQLQSYSPYLPLYYIVQKCLSEAIANKWVPIFTKVIFGIYWFITTLRVHNKQSLLKACGKIALVYLLIASPGYWPWYVGTPVVLMALAPQSNFWLLFLLSFCSRLVAPIEIIRGNGFISWKYAALITISVGVLLPLFSFLMLSRKSRIRRRIQEKI